MKNKKITIDDLARMVKKGFDGVDKRFDRIENRLERIEKIILKQQSQKIEFLEKRICRLEEALAIK
jgi:archaellum component FlaC